MQIKKKHQSEGLVTHYNISAYADDMFFSLTSPNVSLPNLMAKS